MKSRTKFIEIPLFAILRGHYFRVNERLFSPIRVKCHDAKTSQLVLTCSKYGKAIRYVKQTRLVFIVDSK